MMSKPSKNTFSSDKHDTLEVTYTNNLLDETFNSNLETAQDIDDIQSSISQQPVNPLYVKNSSSVSKLTLPKTSLVEDVRFWREQVKRSDEMADKVTEVQINQVQNCGEEQQIFTFAPTSSSSPDTFTPFKTKKDRIPDDITKWTVSLSGKNLLIVGQNKDGNKPIARVCIRRISGYIFHDSNNIVCALLGPSDLDTNLPQYILDKFKMGIPEDWQNVIEYWRHFISLGCPSKYKWPLPNMSLNSNYSKNYYDTETDFSVVESNRSSLTTEQLRKKIAKWTRRLDVQILKESMSNSNMGFNRENSIRNNSSLPCQAVQKNNISVPNKIVNSNVSHEQLNENKFSSIKTASKEQNKVDTLFSRNQSNSEMVSFFNKIPVRVESLKTANAENVKISSEESFHLLLSSDGTGTNQERNKTLKKGTEIKQLNSGSDIFSVNENKIKPTNNSTQKTGKISEKNSGTTSFVSLNFSEQSKLSSTARNTTSNKVLNLEEKTNRSINNSEINLSSRGRIRVATLPYWQGSRLLVDKVEKTILNTSKNDTDVILIPNNDTVKKLERNKNWKKSENSQSETSQEKSDSESSPEKSTEIISKSQDSGIFLKDTNINSKLNRKQNLNNCETKNSLEQIQSNSSPEKSTDSISKTQDSGLFFQPSNTVTVKKPEKKNYKKSEISQSESSQHRFQLDTSPRKSVKDKSDISDLVEFLKPPDIDTIKKPGIKKGSRKNNSQSQEKLSLDPTPNRFQSDTSPRKSMKDKSDISDSDEFLKPPDIETVKRPGRKKGWSKNNSQSQEKLSLDPSPKRFQSDTSSRKSMKDKSDISDSDEFLKPPDIETIKKPGRKKGSSKNNSQSQKKLSLDPSPKSTKNISHSINEVNLKLKKSGRKKGWNNAQTDESQAESSPEKSLENCSKLISTTAIIETKQTDLSPEKFSFHSNKKFTESISNSQDSKPLDVIKKRGRKRGNNKNTSEESLFESSENSSKVISKTQELNIFLKSTEIDVKKRGRKNDLNKIQIDESQEENTFLSPEIFDENISKSQDSDVFLKPPDVKKRGRKKGWNKIKTDTSQETSEEKSQSESSPEKILKVSNSLDELFLKPSDIDSIKISSRRKGRPKNTELASEIMSKDSVISISNSVISSDSSVASVSSRGRIRVPTLPFWQGQRLTVYKKEVVIEQTVTSRCNIENYANDDSYAEKSFTTKSPKKLTNVSQNSPSLTYENVFNETAFKKPENNNTSVVKMQLMSTLRNSLNNNTINKSNENNQALKINSPFKKLIIDIQNSSNINKIITSKLEKSTVSSAKRSISPNKTKTKISKTEENISFPTRGSKTRKQLNFNEESYDKTVKQNKLNKKDDNLKETNESSNSKQLPFRLRSKSESRTKRQLSSIELTNDIIVKQNKLNKKDDNLKETNENSNSKQLPFRLRSKSESRTKKQLSSSEVINDKLIETNKSNKNVDNMKETNDSSKQSPFRRQTRSASKKLIYDTLITNNNTSKSLELNENYLKNLSLKSSLNKKINSKLNTPKEQKNTSSRRSTRSHSEIITQDIKQIQDQEFKKVEKRSKKKSERNNLPPKDSRKEIIESKKNCKSESIENTTNKFKEIVELRNSPRNSKYLQNKPRLLNLKSRLRPKKSTAKNNFNFTVQDITHIEENVPNRTKNNKKEPTKLSVKRTTQFKVAKTTNIPTDPQQLQLMVNKLKKTKKKEPPSDVKIIPKVACPESFSAEPRKRKLFEYNDFMQSEKCVKLLTQNNPDELETSPKFVIRFNPSGRRQETDDEIFSEISMR